MKTKKMTIIMFVLAFLLVSTQANSLQDNEITLKFQHIPLRAALQLLAEIGRVNLIVGDKVKGDITLNLNHVSWRRAFHLILKTQDLVKQSFGNTIFVKTKTALAQEQTDDMKRKQLMAQSQPIITKLITLHHISAKDVEEVIKKNPHLLSKTGTIGTIAHSNRLLVQDKPNQIYHLKKLLHQIDKPTQEILIQARIMDMDRQFERSLGVRFGASRPSHLSGTLAGANQIANNVSQGIAKPVADVPLNQRLNFDLPAAIDGLIQAPSIGIALAKLGKGALLDLELSAVEAEGGGKLLSAPHLVTANMTPAFIEAGEEIPYEESTSGGATAASFKKAVLGLRVTPQILPQHKIKLDINVNQDKRGSDIVKGEPAIDTRKISTQVVVEDGQTVVLGGIFEQGKIHREVRVPFLSQLPLLGHLFKSNYRQSEEQELLVFITPQILATSKQKDTAIPAGNGCSDRMGDSSP